MKPPPSRERTGLDIFNTAGVAVTGIIFGMVFGMAMNNLSPSDITNDLRYRELLAKLELAEQEITTLKVELLVEQRRRTK